MRARVDTPAGELRPGDAAPRPRQPGQRAGGHRRGARVRRAARRDCAPPPPRCDRPIGAASCGACATASRSIDDSYNSSPSALRLGARGDGARDARARGRWRCSARCSSWASTPWRCTGECGRARRRPRACALLVAVGGAAARALARRGGRRRDAGAAVRHHASSADAAADVVAVAARRRSRARQGIARHALRRRGRSHRGGARLMLYYLLPPLASLALSGVPERDALHHVPHRGGQPDGARHQPGARARG